jgi:hypothetical protein
MNEHNWITGYVCRIAICFSPGVPVSADPTYVRRTIGEADDTSGIYLRHYLTLANLVLGQQLLKQ